MKCIALISVPHSNGAAPPHAVWYIYRLVYRHRATTVLFLFFIFYTIYRDRPVGGHTGESIRDQQDIRKGRRQRGNSLRRERQPASADRLETVFRRSDDARRRGREGV